MEEKTTPRRAIPEWVEDVIGKLRDAGLQEYDATRGIMNDDGLKDWSVAVASQDGVFSHTELKRLFMIASRLEVFMEIRGGPPRLNDLNDEHSKVIAVFHNVSDMAKEAPAADEEFPFDEDDNP